MDTVTEVTVIQRRPQDIEKVWRSIDSLLLDWQNRFSETTAQSEVLRFNSTLDSIQTVSPQLAEMLGTGLRYGDTLAGGFDVTVLPLKELWGLDEQHAADSVHMVPSEQQIDSVLRHVDYRRLRLDAATRSVTRLDPKVRVDVGGLAKCWAIVESMKLLDRLGFDSYLISAGGDIGSKGRRLDGNPWLIGVQHPRRPHGELVATIRLDSGSIFTSGDYERYWFTPDGQRVHHLFDPHTGRSATRNQSLTIWDADPKEAKVMSTGLFSRAPDSIVAFVEARPRLECVVIDSSGAIFVSRGWKDQVQLR
jgi:thiamine biosynthesis lipoprotein